MGNFTPFDGNCAYERATNLATHCLGIPKCVAQFAFGAPHRTFQNTGPGRGLYSNFMEIALFGVEKNLTKNIRWKKTFKKNSG